MPELHINGRRLKNLREAYPLTQGQLATKAKMKQDHISKLETGARKTLRFATLDKLANALSVNPTDLLVGDTEVPLRRRQPQEIAAELLESLRRAEESGATMVPSLENQRLSAGHGAPVDSRRIERGALVKRLTIRPELGRRLLYRPARTSRGFGERRDKHELHAGQIAGAVGFAVHN